MRVLQATRLNVGTRSEILRSTERKGGLHLHFSTETSRRDHRVHAFVLSPSVSVVRKTGRLEGRWGIS